MDRFVFVTRGTYSFIDGAIDFAVYKDTENSNMMVRMLRLANDEDWYMPQPGMHSEVATKISSANFSVLVDSTMACDAANIFPHTDFGSWYKDNC